MKAATHPPRTRDAVRMMVVDPALPDVVDTDVRALPTHLRRGDVVVLNDAATLPASLPLQVDAHDAELKLK